LGIVIVPFLPKSGEVPVVAKKRKRRLLLLILVILAGFLSAFLIFIAVNLAAQLLLPQSGGKQSVLYPWEQVVPGEKILLVMGVDAPGKMRGIRSSQNETDNSFERTRTDTMMLVRIYAKAKRMSVVSIPRDSKIYLSNNQVDKINAAHVVGGPEKSVQAVQDAFGIPIDNFIVINFSALRNLVDAVGGIDITIDKPMHYKDNTAKLYIDFKPGQYHLDGKDAERYLRFRHDQHGDIGRISRQQVFFAALAKKMAQPAFAMRIPSLFKQLSQSFETDLSQQSLLGLAVFAKQLEPKNIRVATIPGHPSQQEKASFWIVDSYPAQIVLDRMILGHGNLETDRGNFFSVNSKPETPVKVGLIVDKSHAQHVEKLEQALKKQGHQVVCTQVQSVPHPLIVEHTQQASDATTDRFRKLYKDLENARLLFVPVGTTFERNACSTQEDYTLFFASNPQK
jgi:LCP family protein required for cell wall assembly